LAKAVKPKIDSEPPAIVFFKNSLRFIVISFGSL
jgi:hypothetical protein